MGAAVAWGPASHWAQEGFPLGRGRLGAMLRAKRERWGQR